MPNAQNPDPAKTVAAPSAGAPDATASGATRPTSSELNLGAPAAPGEVGTLGPYRIVRELGRGGMGAVYLAVDTRLDRELALKVMLPAFAADPAARERFLREAKAVAKVAHDHVVTIFEADERDGVPYIAMQFLRGYPLDEYLKKKGALPLAHCVRIVREAALGLGAAHARGLVHRDIKPANLWLEAPNGRVKVLDFGLAKPMGTDTELTKSGAVVGTPAYMSPEQARGLKVDHRTDVFSLGAVLYRLLTGRNPFLGDHIMAVLTALAVEEPTPVRELNPNVPAALADLVNQLLSKKPEERPQTAAEVAERLRSILSQPAADISTSQPVVVHPVPVPMVVTAPENAFANLIDDEDEADRTERETEPVREPAAPKRGKGPLIAGGALALVAAVGVAIALGTGGKKPDDVAKQPDPVGPGTPGKKEKEKDKLTPKPGETSPQSVADTAPFPFLALKGHTGAVSAASFSADGTRVVTASADQTAKVWDAKTGTVLFTLKGHTGAVSAASFSADGGRVLTASWDQTAKVWDATSGTELRALKGHSDAVDGASFSADGARVVTASRDRTAKVWDAKTGTELFALKGHADVVYAASFSADGARVVTASHDQTAKVWDAHSGTADGATQVGKELLTLKGHTGAVVTAAFSADGARVVTASWDQTAKVWDAKTGAELFALNGHSGWVTAASFSSDGARVVTASSDQTARIWTARPTGAPATDLTPAGATEWSKWWVAHGAQDWKLQDGRLMNGNAQRGWIGTKAEYTDFEIELEYKLGARGNSGVFLRAWAEGDISGSQFVEVQLIDDGGYKVTGLTGTGAVFKRVPPNPVPSTKLNEWNAATVRVVGKRVTVTINGTKCVDEDVEFPRAKGVIGLQQLDSPVEFRSVRVRDLSQVAATATDRAAAEWVFSVGGSVQLASGGEARAAGQLPKEPFRLRTAVMINAKGVTGEGLDLLRRCPELDALTFTGSDVTDAALARLAGMRLNHLLVTDTAVGDDGLAVVKTLNEVHDLHFENTRVTDKGLAHLAGVKLNGLYLNGTAITDGGVPALAATDPRNLFLQGTKVTAAGVLKLGMALPKCTITWDGGSIEASAKGDDRAAALRAIELGGKVTIRDGAGTRTVDKVADLPPAVTVTALSATGSQTLKDADATTFAGLRDLATLELATTALTDGGLARLKPLTALQHLNANYTAVVGAGLQHLSGSTALNELFLVGTQLKDANLAYLKPFKKLRVLSVAQTKLTGAGFVYLKELSELAQLVASETEVNDAALDSLKGLTGLRLLNLNKTKVTEAGVKNLASALPACRIVWNGGTIEPTK